MILYIIKRLLMFIPILLGISLICLILMDIARRPAEIIVGIQDNEGDRQAKVEAVREELGLNKPFMCVTSISLGTCFRATLDLTSTQSGPSDPI